MNTLKVKFKNCFGISKLEHEFDFNKSNVNLIYAKNGSMKTSFAKIFNKFQLNKENEIKDLIHDRQPVDKIIKTICRGKETDINKKEIFVIKSFIPSYESDEIATLLVNDKLKEKISEILELKKLLLKNLVKKSGIKISGIVGGKTEYKLEPQILKDFSIEKESFLKNLEDLYDNSISDEYTDIKYSTIFDALDIIETSDFQENISAFLEKSNEIYSNYKFLEKGEFSLAKLKKVQTELGKQSFFIKNNKLKFGGHDISENNLKELIKEIEDKLQNINEFKVLKKILEKTKGIPLQDIIENNPSIIEKLQLKNLENFRKELWQCYLKESKDLFNSLKIKLREIEPEISNINIEQTPWRHIIDIFNDRFFLPFRMDISNLESSVIGESVPKIIFKFPKDRNFENNDEDNWEELDRKNLEEKDVLSQGEKRALYLLNIIFELEARKKAKQKTLLIIDDIADSFDYKNKYAIVEYIRDLSKDDFFYLVILTHNFDFFRTVQERVLNKAKWDNSFIAQKNSTKITLKNAGNKNIVNPFAEWRQNFHMDFKALIPAIPFVRNLIEFSGDNKTKEYFTLTYVLHQKNQEKKDDNKIVLSKKTDDILISDLELIFKNIINGSYFKYSEDEKNKTVIEVIFELADEIIGDDDLDSIAVGNKIILSIASRLKVEKFIWNKITDSSPINGAQTGKLFQKYKNEFKNVKSEEGNIKILESVNIMTPENIHINSFMYEPILDMDIVELKNLYQKVKTLNITE